MTDTPTKAEASIPGFQGSETTRCEVYIYSHGNDPIVFGQTPGLIQTNGKNEQSENPALINVSTSKSMSSAGTFSISLKARGNEEEDLLDQIVDDDWVDIVFKRHNKPWTVIRGLIDDVRRNRSVGGTGASSTTYSLVGRDFQKIWESTEAWFNMFTHENTGGAATVRIFNILETVSGDPGTAVRAYLLNFLRELDGFGRANWAVPPGMPTIGGDSFANVINIDTSNFSNIPPRKGISPNFMSPRGFLWNLAKEWSDEPFTELWCDVSGPNGPLFPGEELDLVDSEISVFFRDKPFIIRKATADLAQSLYGSDAITGGNQSAWFKLPTFIVPRQQITTDDIGRSGTERINAFFMSPQMSQELIQTGSIALGVPYWNTRDMKRHGMRRYDIYSRYVADKADIITLSRLSRQLLVDWHCLNAYFLNGSMNLALARPDIRIGSRVTVPGASGDTAQDETYYVEGVNHTWNFRQGGRTTLKLSRGYKGTDTDILEKLEEYAGEFEESPFTPPEERVQPNPIQDPDADLD